MADANNEEAPKIIVDDDWKQQAAREKEEADRASKEQANTENLPGPTLAEIVHIVAMQAAFGLGGMQDPQTGQPVPAQLPLAKHYIDLLELFQQKTAQSVTEEEKQMIDGTLYELQMAFVQATGGGATPPPQKES